MMGTPGHRTTHLKVLYQGFDQLKMFTVFRDGQQIKFLYALRPILHPLPQYSLVQQCSNLAHTTTQNSEVLLRPPIGRVTEKSVSGSVPVRYATALGRRSPCQACWTVGPSQGI